MTYKIRKRKNLTLYLASQVIELDPNDFRKLDENPYKGDSQEEFLNYISNFNIDDESLTDKIRKRENLTLYLISQVIELDPNDFRKLDENPYKGDSQEEFLNYISNFNIDDESLTDQLDESVKEELQKLGENIEWIEFGNSAQKGSDEWYELGEEDESYRRTGGFDISCSTNN